MTKPKKLCGIVMPISDCDGMSNSHWTDVLKIIETTARDSGYDTRLVSDTFESNLIHKEILQNIYNDDLIICDVSGRNPNVFFELGIRMATQKPTVIIKDDVTAYPFDTGPNRYVEYPRDLRHPSIEKFKASLTKSIEKTANQGPENSFIGNLGPFQIPEVDSTTIPVNEAILERLQSIEERIARTSLPSKNFNGQLSEKIPFGPTQMVQIFRTGVKSADITVEGFSQESVTDAMKLLSKFIGSRELDFEINKLGESDWIITIRATAIRSPEFRSLVRRAFDECVPF